MKKLRIVKSLLLLLAVVMILSGCSLLDKTESKDIVVDELEIETGTASEHEVSEPVEIQKPSDPEPVISEEPPKPTGKTRLTIRAVGDIMTHGPQIESAKQADGSYDFNPVFEKIKPFLENADITIGNFETTVSTPEKGYSGYPRFRSPAALLEALKEAGFDVLTTANNHSFDGTEFGVTYTLDKMDEYGILHTGTARTPEERDEILILEKNDIKVAILAYTYGTNGMEAAIDEDKLPYMVNYLHDMARIKKDIRRARESGAEVIIACVHWGSEYVRKPNERQKQLADQLFAAGVDIILGSHPHVLQPMEKRIITTDEGIEKEVFVIYSLGNFISNQRDRYRDSGIIINLEIVKDYDAGTVGIGEISYIPTWVHKYTENGKNHYRILPVIQEENPDLSGSAKERVKQVWNETTSHMGTEEFPVRTH